MHHVKHMFTNLEQFDFSVKWYFEVLIMSMVCLFPDSAAAGFMTLNGMENLLSHQYFKTENRTEMYSDVITAILPLMNNTNLTEPVNFTIHHKKVLSSPIFNFDRF